MKLHLKEWRDSKGWSQAELEARAELSAGSVSRLENRGRKQPRSDTLEKLAKAFGVSDPDDLFGPPPSGEKPQNIPTLEEFVEAWGEINDAEKPRALKVLKSYRGAA